MSRFDSVQCKRCKLEFGPVCRKVETITVGQQTYVMRACDRIGICCERCGALNGSEKEFSGPCQDARCPGCNKKSAEIYRDGVVMEAADGRKVYARRVVQIICRCETFWAPKYIESEHIVIPKVPLLDKLGGALRMQTQPA